MKKLVTILLAFSMFFSVGATFADTASEFDFSDEKSLWMRTIIK